MDNHADIVQLRALNEQYEKITLELNGKIMELGTAKSNVQVLDAKVKQLSNMLNLVLENIRCEKKIMDVIK